MIFLLFVYWCTDPTNREKKIGHGFARLALLHSALEAFIINISAGCVSLQAVAKGVPVPPLISDIISFEFIRIRIHPDQDASELGFIRIRIHTDQD